MAPPVVPITEVFMETCEKQWGGRVCLALASPESIVLWDMPDRPAWWKPELLPALPD